MGHHDLSCGARFFKGLHIFVNVLFLLAGAGLIGAGAYVLATNGATLTTALSNLGPLAIVVIVAGGVIFVISFIGCCGAARESRCMLNLYSFLLIIFIVAEASLAIYIFVHRNNFSESAMQSELSTAWAKLPIDTQEQIEADLKCCGWNGPTLNGGHPCDKMMPAEQGCESIIVSWFQHSYFVLAMVAIGVAAVQLFGLIVACCLAGAIRNAKHREHDRERLLHQAREANRLPPTTVYTVNAPVGYGYVQTAQTVPHHQGYQQRH